MSILGRRAPVPGRRLLPESPGTAPGPIVAATAPTSGHAEAAPGSVDHDLAHMPDTVPAAWELIYGLYARIDVRSARRRRWFGRLRARAGVPRRTGG